MTRYQSVQLFSVRLECIFKGDFPAAMTFAAEGLAEEEEDEDDMLLNNKPLGNDRPFYI